MLAAACVKRLELRENRSGSQRQKVEGHLLTLSQTTRHSGRTDDSAVRLVSQADIANHSDLLKAVAAKSRK